MSGKPVAFQDVASNIFNYTIQTSKEQCKKAEAKLKQVSPAAQDETYARVGAVGNGGVKNATLGREALAKDLNYAGLSQQFCTVSSDVATCIEIQKLFAQHKSTDSAYSTLSPHAQREIEAYGPHRQAAIAAFVQKYDPLPIAQAIEGEVFIVVKGIKKDIDLANEHANLFSNQPLSQRRERELQGFYQKLSTPAKCMIEQIKSTMASGKDSKAAEDLREACYSFFSRLVGHAVDYKTVSKPWKLSKEECIYAHFYLKSSEDFSNLLPRFRDNAPVISEHEFKAKFSSLYPKIPKPNIDFFHHCCLELATQCAHQAIANAYSAHMAEMGALLCMTDQRTRQQCALLGYENLPEAAKNALHSIFALKHTIPFKEAPIEEWQEACQTLRAQRINEQLKEVKKNFEAKYGWAPDCQITVKTAEEHK